MDIHASRTTWMIVWSLGSLTALPILLTVQPIFAADARVSLFKSLVVPAPGHGRILLLDGSVWFGYRRAAEPIDKSEDIKVPDSQAFLVWNKTDHAGRMLLKSNCDDRDSFLGVEGKSGRLIVTELADKGASWRFEEGKNLAFKQRFVVTDIDGTARRWWIDYDRTEYRRDAKSGDIRVLHPVFASAQKSTAVTPEEEQGWTFGVPVVTKIRSEARMTVFEGKIVCVVGGVSSDSNKDAPEYDPAFAETAFDVEEAADGNLLRTKTGYVAYQKSEKGYHLKVVKDRVSAAAWHFDKAERGRRTKSQLQTIVDGLRYGAVLNAAAAKDFRLKGHADNIERLYPIQLSTELKTEYWIQFH